jgi:quercetin dioxygenase-like cupin family protein
MALPHTAPGESRDVHPFGTDLPSQKTHALFKSSDLEVMRLVLLAGQSLPPHKVAGEITSQCIEGQFNVDMDGKAHLLNSGQLLFLPAGRLHAVQAQLNSSALVTIALK